MIKRTENKRGVSIDDVRHSLSLLLATARLQIELRNLDTSDT